MPGLNVTTVYRTLEDLNQVGLVDLMSTSKDQVRFSLRRTDQRHAHLVCRGCGGMETLGLARFEGLAQELQREHGFRVDLDHLTLSGTCGRCVSETVEHFHERQNGCEHEKSGHQAHAEQHERLQ